MKLGLTGIGAIGVTGAVIAISTGVVLSSWDDNNPLLNNTALKLSIPNPVWGDYKESIGWSSAAKFELKGNNLSGLTANPANPTITDLLPAFAPENSSDEKAWNGFKVKGATADWGAIFPNQPYLYIEYGPHRGFEAPLNEMIQQAHSARISETIWAVPSKAHPGQYHVVIALRKTPATETEIKQWATFAGTQTVAMTQALETMPENSLPESRNADVPSQIATVSLNAEEGPTITLQGIAFKERAAQLAPKEQFPQPMILQSPQFIETQKGDYIFATGYMAPNFASNYAVTLRAATAGGEKALYKDEPTNPVSVNVVQNITTTGNHSSVQTANVMILSGPRTIGSR